MHELTEERHKDEFAASIEIPRGGKTGSIIQSANKVFLLLAEELPHARLPAAALVQGDASVLGAAPGEPRALPPEHVNELLLAQVAHLLVDEGRRGLDRREKKNISSCCYMLRSITVKFTCFMSSW